MTASLPGTPNLAAETVLWGLGVLRVAGIDEAGRGAWAGPVAAAAVILPAEPRILSELEGVRDSKLMTPRERAEWAAVIRVKAAAWSVAPASNTEIDTLGILPATRLAMRRAIQGLKIAPDHLLIDAVRLPGCPIRQTALIHGDRLVLSIAAASVLAKTWRDGLMIELDREYPLYGFSRHKGYGTRLHAATLAEFGPCPAHRASYAPVKAALAARV